MTMGRAPEPLRRGDRVRIIAPSGPFDEARLEAGVDSLRAAGLTPVFDRSILSHHLHFAGSDARRRQELGAALRERDTRAIWAARGGYGAARVVGHVEPQQVAAAGKWLVGYSDVTALHSLWRRAGLCSLHAANVTGLPAWDGQARTELFGMLAGQLRSVLQGTELFAGPPVQGPVCGGNLTVLASLCGTGLLPSFRGALLFIEDVSERPYRLHRALTQLCLSGALQGLRGVAIGQLTDCEPARPGDTPALEALADVLAELGVPVVQGLAVGHDDLTSRPLPLGAMARLDAAAGTLEVGLPP